VDLQRHSYTAVLDGELPRLTCAARQGLPIATIEATFPSPTLTAEPTLLQPEAVTYCINLSTGAMSLWRGVAFSNVCRIHDRFFGVEEADFKVLAGGLDNGAAFLARIQTHPNALLPEDAPKSLIANLKRVTAAYLQTLQRCTLRIWFDGGHGSADCEFHAGKRARLGRGAKGRNAVIAIESEAENFALEYITLDVDILGRRAQ